MAVQSSGVLYVLIGSAGRPEFDVSVRSVRRHMPDLPITVVTDQDVDGPFDDVRRVSASDGFRAKVEALANQPYDRTLFLDCDTYVVRPIGALFDLLDRFDIAVAHDSIRIEVPVAEVPETFPAVNSGVLVLRRNERTQALTRRWLELFETHSELGAPARDQPWLRKALFDATAADIQLAILPQEYNCRILMAGQYNLPVAILHSHATEEQFARAAAVAGNPLPVFWSQYVHFDAQIWGPLGSAQKLLDLRPWWARRRITRVTRRVITRFTPFGRPRAG